MSNNNKNMTQEEKDLLLKDLCARVPYGLICKSNSYKKILFNSSHISLIETEEIKPYLFPLSSMTEEQKKEFIQYAKYEVEDTVCGIHYDEYYLSDYVGTPEEPICNYNAIDWLNKNHFDYRGLIEKGLALDATNLNIY